MSVTPSMWAEFRQFLSEKRKKRERNRWPLEKRRSWTLFFGGFAVSTVSIVGIFVLIGTTQILWFLLLIPVWAIMVSVWGSFQNWYDRTHKTG